MTESSHSLRTFVAYVEDRPGVLNRIASLFRRRNYNIVSLNVGRTHEAGISRMTFQMEADDDMARRIEANLYKMVHVLSVEDITNTQSVIRDLALIKVRVGPERRAEDGLVATLRPFGIVEMVQTGTVAMTRGNQGAAARAAHTEDASGIAAA